MKPGWQCNRRLARTRTDRKCGLPQASHFVLSTSKLHFVLKLQKPIILCLHHDAASELIKAQSGCRRCWGVQRQKYVAVSTSNLPDGTASIEPKQGSYCMQQVPHVSTLSGSDSNPRLNPTVTCCCCRRRTSSIMSTFLSRRKLSTSSDKPPKDPTCT